MSEEQNNKQDKFTNKDYAILIICAFVMGLGVSLWLLISRLENIGSVMFMLGGIILNYRYNKKLREFCFSDSKIQRDELKNYFILLSPGTTIGIIFLILIFFDSPFSVDRPNIENSSGSIYIPEDLDQIQPGNITNNSQVDPEQFKAGLISIVSKYEELQVEDYLLSNGAVRFEKLAEDVVDIMPKILRENHDKLSIIEKKDTLKRARESGEETIYLLCLFELIKTEKDYDFLAELIDSADKIKDIDIPVTFGASSVEIRKNALKKMRNEVERERNSLIADFEREFRLRLDS